MTILKQPQKSTKIIIFLTLITLTFSAMSSKMAQACLNLNKYDGLAKGEKVIGKKETCFSAGKQCCFINITHVYGDYPLKMEYCNYLNVNITTFKKFLYDMYNDDEMYYANFTAHNIEMYQTIGRNLDKSLVNLLDCYLGPQTNNEYSTYVDKNCKLFVDGICQGAKNTTRFNSWLTGFHQGYSDAYCNKKQDRNKKCIRYDGARSNDKMIRPLLEELRDYLQADNDEYIVVNNESNVDINPDAEDEEGASTYVPNFIVNGKVVKPCKPRPNITITVECPEGYVGQNYINFYFLYMVIFISLLF